MARMLWNRSPPGALSIKVKLFPVVGRASLCWACPPRISYLQRLAGDGPVGRMSARKQTVLENSQETRRKVHGECKGDRVFESGPEHRVLGCHSVLPAQRAG